MTAAAPSNEGPDGALSRKGIPFSMWPEALFFERLSRRRSTVAVSHSRGTWGNHRTRQRGAGDAFFDHRAYAPGDDVRHIDWSLYARLGRPLVRRFEAEGGREILLVVDASASMRIGRPRKCDFSLRLAAGVTFAAHGARNRIEILAARDGLFALDVTTKANPVQQVEALAAMDPAGNTQLAQVAAALVAHVKPTTQLVWISDFLDPSGVEPACRALRTAGHMPLLVQVEAKEDVAPEQAWTGSHRLQLEDSETGQQVPIALTRNVFESYQRQRQNYNAALERLCQARGIRLVRMGSDEAFGTAVLRLLRHLGL